MRTTLKLIATIIVLTASWYFAHGQKTTERFIPIGKSPGLSGKFTLIARVGAIDLENRTLTCTNYAGKHTVKVMEQTRIWIDRSHIDQTNQVGKLTDCQRGRLMEVKFVDKERKEGPAEWIKVAVPEPAPAARKP